MKPWKKGLHVLSGLLRSRHLPRIPIITGALAIILTPEGEKRRICAEQQERKRRLDMLLAEASVFRQEPHEQH